MIKSYFINKRLFAYISIFFVSIFTQDFLNDLFINEYFPYFILKIFLPLSIIAFASGMLIAYCQNTYYKNIIVYGYDPVTKCYGCVLKHTNIISMLYLFKHYKWTKEIADEIFIKHHEISSFKYNKKRNYIMFTFYHNNNDNSNKDYHNYVELKWLLPANKIHCVSIEDKPVHYDEIKKHDYKLFAMANLEVLSKTLYKDKITSDKLFTNDLIKYYRKNNIGILRNHLKILDEKYFDLEIRSLGKLINTMKEN